jgi:hypothetical protein
MPTEEGLASFMQDEYGEHGEALLFHHAAEYVTSSVGLGGSLRDKATSGGYALAAVFR